MPKLTNRTRLVRLSEDLADILGAMYALDGASIPAVLDPLVRPELEAWAKRNRRRIDSLNDIRAPRRKEETRP